MHEQAYPCEEWVLRNDLAELERLGESVAGLAARCGWPSGIAQDVELALDEVVTNIISYAWDDDASHSIRVRIRSGAETITIEVEDDGREFDPRSTADSAVTDGDVGARPIGGLGWYLVRSVVDELEYRREGGRNIVTMEKRVSC